MGLFSRFENKMEDTLEGAANKMFDAPISPVQIAKKAEKQMRREAMVGAGKQFAPTLYTVLVNPDDDERLFGYYPTLAGETETYLKARAAEDGLAMDGTPLVRFVVDDGLKHGKFDVIAELVAAPIVAQLRQEELERYGIAPARTQQAPAQRRQTGQRPARRAPEREAPVETKAGYGYGEDASDDQEIRGGYANDPFGDYADSAQAPARKPPLPYVPDEEIDYSIDYGKYTFNSEDFEDRRDKDRRDKQRARGAAAGAAAAVGAAGADAAAGAEVFGAGAFTAGAGAGGAAGGARAAAGGRANTIAYAAGSQGGRPDRSRVRARLIDAAYQRSYDLAGTHLTIGRENGNDIVVPDISASRRHAELTLTPQGVWTVSDRGSTNGTLVNGVPVASQPLHNGDIVTIGKTDLEFVVG